MKKRLALSAILIFLIVTTQAQLLWEISGNKLKEKSYIFGTHHLISTSFLDSIPQLYASFNSSKAVVSEIALNSFDGNLKIQEWATLPDSLSLSTLLSDDDYNYLDIEFEKLFDVNLRLLDKMHPAMIQSLVQVELFKKLEPYDSKPKTDSFFQIVANEKGMPVIALETIDDQLQILYPKENLKKQANDLVQFVKRKEEAKSDLAELNRLYKLGDLDALLAFIEISNKRWEVSYEENYKLLDNRNIKWVEKLPEILNSGSCFIAVGALHLPGNNGLINLLKNSGYKLVPVENSNTKSKWKQLLQ